MRNPDEKLPPMLGTTPPPPERLPIIVYINGLPIEMSKREALGVISRIADILANTEEYPYDPMPRRRR